MLGDAYLGSELENEPEKSNRIRQSAGNLNIMYSFLESSETIREAILAKNSDRAWKSVLINRKKLSISFLNWFLGFSEGYFLNISFIFCNLNGYYIFEIKKINIQILYYIKKNLRVGKVNFDKIKQFSFWRFCILKKKYFIDVFFFTLPNLYLST